MDKMLFLLVGILLKQTIDEIKSLVAVYVEHLKQYRDAVSTYRPNPAIEYGSPEIINIMARHQHDTAVEPEVKKLTRRILLLRLLPLVAYLFTTISLIVCIFILESSVK